ncbi:protein NPAT isoform X2 [Bombina bombina]|uniref:protein NPAT isoform X2 n=1 Tax=Bombina bombina TaxID=8345 RepID=UPI00235AAF6E|nr:protein NPAT isoform X2 [Bombina bombina]
MLLPSDIARLVLGYLQQEKLTSTCQAFIAESPNLKEYAEHYTDEGFIPGCVLSLFGKNLTTILNEYTSLKAKDSKDKSREDMPAMLSSLWKKLDHTLSQIRNMQESAVFYPLQRARTRNGIEKIREQRLALSPLASPGSNALRVGQQTSTPITSTQIVLRPLTTQTISKVVANPLFLSQSSIQGNSSLDSNGDTLQIISLGPPEKKLPSVHSSPMRRKNDSHRRRRAAVPSSNAVSLEDSGQENDSLQELIAENFPQMVIENAREKILSNKSLQEKLAENINKILGSDCAAHTSKPTDSENVEASIDEILGLQGGEMHMSEDAIHEILEQTELDPDFQELYDLFAFGPSKAVKNAPHDPTPHTERSSKSNLSNENLNIDKPMEANVNSASDINPADVHIKEKENPESSVKCISPSASSQVNSASDINPADVHMKEKENPESSIKCISPSASSQVNSASDINPADVHMKEKENPDSSKCISPSASSQKTTSVSKTCESEKTLAMDQSLITENDQITVDSNSNMDIIENEEIVKSKDSHTALPQQAASQSQDNEMTNMSNTHGNETEMSLDENTSATTNDQIIQTTKLNEKTCMESSQTHTSQMAAEEEGLQATPEEADVTGKATKQCRKEDEEVTDLDSAEVPLFKSRSLEEDDTPEELITISNDDDFIHETPVKDLIVDNSSTSSDKELKEKEKMFDNPENQNNTLLKNNTETVTIIPSEHHLPSVSAGNESANVVVDSLPSSSIAGSVSCSQTTDTSNIVTLNIISEDVTSVTELSNAVKGICGENIPVLILSSPTKPQDGNYIDLTQTCFVEETVDSSVSGNQSYTVSQSQEASTNAVNILAEDCTVFSVAGTSNLSSDGGLVQIVPATSSTFAPTNSIFISSCMTNNSTGNQSNIIMLPKTSATATPKQPCIFQTPPRQSSLYGRAISPKITPGSTIILTSSGQPVLQGMMGMFPVSVIGQSGNTFAAPSHQVLHVPVSRGIAPKIPLPPRPPKPTASRRCANMGKQLTVPAADSTNRPSSITVKRVENTEKPVALDLQEKLPVDTVSSSVKTAESHKRVLCFDNSVTTSVTSNTPAVCNATTVQTRDQKEHGISSSSSVNISSTIRSVLPKDNRKSEKSYPATVTSSRPDIVGISCLVPSTEKRSQASESPAVAIRGTMANKENVLQKESEELSDLHKKTANQGDVTTLIEITVQPVQETVRNQSSLPNILRRTPQDPKKLPPGRAYRTSPLTKQASDILSSMQFHSPNAKSTSEGDIPIPRTPGSAIEDLLAEGTSDHVRRYSEDGGTPKPMLPPMTPELPACSPASEAGSENSVNMAAHTLMILSRASMVKTGSSTPLKDNSQQLKSSRKRKIEESGDQDKQSHKADLYNPSAMLKKKKMKKSRKKSLDSFPSGMDVDKFLMSLNYDE